MSSLNIGVDLDNRSSTARNNPSNVSVTGPVDPVATPVIASRMSLRDRLRRPLGRAPYASSTRTPLESFLPAPANLTSPMRIHPSSNQINHQPGLWNNSHSNYQNSNDPSFSRNLYPAVPNSTQPSSPRLHLVGSIIWRDGTHSIAMMRPDAHRRIVFASSGIANNGYDAVLRDFRGRLTPVSAHALAIEINAGEVVLSTNIDPENNEVEISQSGSFTQTASAMASSSSATTPINLSTHFAAPQLELNQTQLIASIPQIAPPTLLGTRRQLSEDSDAEQSSRRKRVRRNSVIDHSRDPQYRSSFPTADVQNLTDFDWKVMKLYFKPNQRCSLREKDNTQDWKANRPSHPEDELRDPRLRSRPLVKDIRGVISRLNGETKNTLERLLQAKKDADVEYQRARRRRVRDSKEAARVEADRQELINDLSQSEATSGPIIYRPAAAQVFQSISGPGYSQGSVAYFQPSYAFSSSPPVDLVTSTLLQPQAVAETATYVTSVRTDQALMAGNINPHQQHSQGSANSMYWPVSQVYQVGETPVEPEPQIIAENQELTIQDNGLSVEVTREETKHTINFGNEVDGLSNPDEEQQANGISVVSQEVAEAVKCNQGDLQSAVPLCSEVKPTQQDNIDDLFDFDTAAEDLFGLLIQESNESSE